MNKNLKPASLQTEEERRENGRKGGKIGVERKRKKKLLMDLASAFLSCKADKAVSEIISLQFPDFKPIEVTNGLAMIVALHRRALKGDPRAFEVLRDTAGEKPKDRTEISGNMPKLNLIVASESVKK